MIAAALCLLALILTFRAGQSSLGHGLVGLFSVGYCYGIARANLPSAASHFLFDGAILGFYLSQKWSSKPSEALRTGSMQTWALYLSAWPCLLCFVPFQNFWVTLVGLRGNIFFLPMLMFGSRLKRSDLQVLAKGLSILNIVALSVGLLEYFLGIERFIPRSEVTALIYSSNDLAGGAYRIPSMFVNAHAFAGTMVMTLPLLFGAWNQRDQKSTRRQLQLLGMIAALWGMVLAATRLNFVIAAVLVSIAGMSANLSAIKRTAFVSAIIVVVTITLSTSSSERFSSLTQAGVVTERIGGSVNRGFWDILENYPMGNGLGGGGTSMPYFLQNQVSNPIAMENEYARILAEQGVVGLLLWLAFILGHLLNRSAFYKSPWRNSRLLAWFACTLCFGTGLIGTGLLTSIPQSAMLLLFLGWISTAEASEGTSFNMPSIVAMRPRRKLTSTLTA